MFVATVHDNPFNRFIPKNNVQNLHINNYIVSQNFNILSNYKVDIQVLLLSEHCKKNWKTME